MGRAVQRSRHHHTLTDEAIAKSAAPAPAASSGLSLKEGKGMSHVLGQHKKESEDSVKCRTTGLRTPAGHGIGKQGAGARLPRD